VPVERLPGSVESPVEVAARGQQQRPAPGRDGAEPRARDPLLARFERRDQALGAVEVVECDDGFGMVRLEALCCGLADVERRIDRVGAGQLQVGLLEVRRCEGA